MARMLGGVHSKKPPDVVFDAVPGASLTRHFIKGDDGGELEPGYDLVGKFEALCEPTWESEGLPIVSFKLKPADVLDCRWDEELTRLGRYLRDRDDVFVIPHHEPEDDYEDSESAAEFADSFNHIRTVLKDAWAGQVVAYCAMGYQWRPGSANTADVDVWRSIEADLYLCDVYSGNSFPPDLILPEHPGFKRWWAEIVAPFGSRQWGIGERGIMANPGRADTIGRERDWLLGDGSDCALWLWWNTEGQEGEEGWPIDPDLDPYEAQAVRELVAACVVPDGYTVVSDSKVKCDTNGELVDRAWLVRHIDWMAYLDEKLA